MATPRSQRIGIWIIAIVLTVGTLGSFLVMGLSVNNQRSDQEKQQKAYDEYQAQQKTAAQLSADNSEPLKDYATRTFDLTSVDKLQSEVLVEGTGKTIKATDSISASYFGWLSNGKLFDSTKKKETADMPATFSLSGVISGWAEGLTGKKVGSTVRLTIPADKAYGSQPSGIIPANSPLEFIVTVHSVEKAATK